MNEDERRERLEREVHLIREMDDGLPDEAIIAMIFKFMPNILCNIAVFGLIYVLLSQAENKSSGCGVPVWEWLQGGFAFAFLSGL